MSSKNLKEYYKRMFVFATSQIKDYEDHYKNHGDKEVWFGRMQSTAKLKLEYEFMTQIDDKTLEIVESGVDIVLGKFPVYKIAEAFKDVVMRSKNRWHEPKEIDVDFLIKFNVVEKLKNLLGESYGRM